MAKSKKIFILLAIVFLLLLAYASYDISTRTTFPGSRPQLKERLQRDFMSPDSLKTDTLKTLK